MKTKSTKLPTKNTIRKQNQQNYQLKIQYENKITCMLFLVRNLFDIAKYT